MSGIKKLIKEIRWYGPAKIIPGVFGFLGIIIYTRLLSPEEYGLYILAITTISIVNAICFEWLRKSIIRYLEKYKKSGKINEFMSTLVGSLIRVTITILFFWYLIINLLLQNYINLHLVLLLNIGGLVIFAEAGYTSVLCIKQANQKSTQYAIRSIAYAAIKVILATIFIYFFRMGSKSILLGIILAAGGIFIWDIYYFYKNQQIKISLFSKKIFKRLLTYGLPLIGLSIASYILVAADRYMIKYFLTTDDVGIYSANYDLATQFMQFFVGILMLAAYPIIINVFEKKGEKETSILLNKISSLYFLILVPVMFGATILSKNIVKIFLGQNFHSGYVIFPWIVAGIFCFGLTQYLYKPFELKEKTKTLSALVIFTSIINIVLNLFFIPIFGILGAAYSTLISYFIYFIITWLISRKIFMWSFPWQTIAKSILAALGMYLILKPIVSALPINITFLMPEILIGAISYFAILWALQEKVFLNGSKIILKYLKKQNV